ncbi:MAG: hypothetical protein HYY16_09480 [Planctomycetes bacterium]|nr:hypothetical protein [Planctomycetota bacterium]
MTPCPPWTRLAAGLFACLWAFAGCAYSIGPGALYAHSSVRVQVADNLDERRTHEFDLTQAVVRQLQAGGVRVNAPDATARLNLTIVGIDEPALVEGRLDVVQVGAVSFRVRLTLTDVATGKLLVTGEHAESASFAQTRGESRDTARQEVFDRLARWAASKLEKDW